MRTYYVICSFCLSATGFLEWTCEEGHLQGHSTMPQNFKQTWGHGWKCQQWILSNLSYRSGLIYIYREREREHMGVKPISSKSPTFPHSLIAPTPHKVPTTPLHTPSKQQTTSSYNVTFGHIYLRRRSEIPGTF